MNVKKIILILSIILSAVMISSLVSAGVVEGKCGEPPLPACPECTTYTACQGNEPLCGSEPLTIIKCLAAPEDSCNPTARAFSTCPAPIIDEPCIRDICDGGECAKDLLTGSSCPGGTCQNGVCKACIPQCSGKQCGYDRSLDDAGCCFQNWYEDPQNYWSNIRVY